MQYKFLPFLRCPVSGQSLEFKLLSEFSKVYDEESVTEIWEGLLIAECGLVYPVIEGIPRMLPEAIYDYHDFLARHIPEFAAVRNVIEDKFGDLLRYCIKKNKRTKASFEMEWNILKPEKKDRLWHDDQRSLEDVFVRETGLAPGMVGSYTVLDAGCGHGLMTAVIAGLANTAVGMELSKSVENAYKNNHPPNVFFVQGDVQFPPFNPGTFELIYSSGVIHHTNNTELSFSLLLPYLKKGGRICLWLYHPQKKILHHFSLFLWRIISKLPLSLAAVFLTLIVFPFSFLIKKIKGKKELNHREELIDLFDAFTPEFRDEISHDRAISWFNRREMQNVSITTESQFGFSISGNSYKDE